MMEKKIALKLKILNQIKIKILNNCFEFSSVFKKKVL